MGSAGKTKIVVNAASVGEGDSIASYLADGSGNFLSSQVIATIRRLDTNIASDRAGDTAFTLGDYGIAPLAVRKDVAGNIATADGDYVPLQVDANGNLRTSATVTFGAEYAEDSPFTNGDLGIATLLVRQDALAVSTSADGDYGSFKSTNKGELYTHDADTLAALVAQTKAEDSAAVSSDLLTPVAAVRRDTTGTQVSANGDYSEIQTWSNGELKTVDIENSGNLQQIVTVGTGAAIALPTVPLANRKNVLIQMLTSKTLYLGSATTTADQAATGGFELNQGGYVSLDAGPANVIYGTANAASQKVLVWEHA